MPRWRASSPRSRPNARGAKPTAREMRPKQTCSITSSEFETQALQDRLYEPHGVREASWISLSGCHPNRVQATTAGISAAQQDARTWTIGAGGALGCERLRNRPEEPGHQLLFPELQNGLVRSG